MNRWKALFGLVGLGLALIFLAIRGAPDDGLHLVACDVGQGDAILAVYQNVQILVDGGPDNKVLDCLARHLPFWDREIELIVLTHPQEDHFGGLKEVFQRYQVDTFLANKVDTGSQSYQMLKKAVGGSGAKVISPKEGMVIRVGLVYLDILHPSEDLQAGGWSDLNELSVVSDLRFGNFEALLTGDIPPKQISALIAAGKIPDVNYLKVPHHGSKNGLTQELLEVARPEIAVISVGKKNSYGHPHQETLKILRDRDIKILRTDILGDVEIITDGQTSWQKK